MKHIQKNINAFEKKLVNVKQQIRQHSKSLLDYAHVLKEYAEYLYNTQIIEHEIAAVSLARKAIRCYGWVYQSDPQKFQAIYAAILVHWFDFMKLSEDYAEGIILAKKTLAFYQPLLKKQQEQYLPAYAKLLADYGFCLWMDEQTTQAQEILVESLNTYKRLLQNNSTDLLGYCQALHKYAQSLQTTNQKQALDTQVTCLTLLEQSVDQQSIRFKAQKVKALEFYIVLLEDDLLALTQFEQLLPLYQELISLDFKAYACDYANFLMNYANRSENNVWSDGYDGFYEDSPRLALADKLLAEAVEIRAKVLTVGISYQDWHYIRFLKRYTEFLLEQEHPDRAIIFAKKAMDFANKIMAKDNNMKWLGELNYARTCQLYANALAVRGEYNKAAKIALKGIFWYEQITLMDEYSLEELCSGLYEPEDYTEALQSVGQYLDKIGENQQALIYHERAYRLAKRRYDNYQTIYYLQRYLNIFNDYILQLNDNGHVQQALVYSNDLLITAIKKFEIKKYRGSYPPLVVNAYGNNAYILAHNQRYEEALIQTKKALACIGLVWYGFGGSYRQNKAWLLGNLASYQNVLGGGEQGFRNAEKSLAIHLQLFNENPLPYLSSLQRAYGRCAFILKDLGHFDKALDYRKQILALDKQYQLTSSWFDCFEIKWLNWLNDKRIKPFNVVNMADEKLDRRDKQELNFIQYWLLTCFTPSHNYLTRALYYLVHMDQDLQGEYLEELVILMTLLKKHRWVLPESLPITQDWLGHYQRYIEQRKGFVPKWMLATAKKLNINLPAMIREIK